MDAAVIYSVRNLKELGKRQCKDFFKSRLVERTTPLTDRIPKNNFSLFRWRPEKDAGAAKAHRSSYYP